MQELIQRQTSLSANIIQFCRFLRQKGFQIGPTEEADALQAIQILQPYQSSEHFQECIRLALCKSLRQLNKFDDLYLQYWKELEKAVDSKVVESEQEGSQAKQQAAASSFQTLKDWIYGKASEEEEAIASYSANETIGEKDFSRFSEHELHEIMQLIQLIARSLALQFSRRQKKAKRSARLDLARTLRLNRSRGGEIIDLAFQKPPKNKRKIVLLCDVSKSMDLYSQFLIQFMYAFQQAYRSIETFVFSTSLYRVTAHLKEEEFQKTLTDLAQHIPDWSGGTRIGASLSQFCHTYAAKLLDQQTIVLILSDGWDTGDTELLAESMQQIHRKAAKVIWLNPLAGNPAYEPSVKGMQAAMPFIDVFASAHNAASLRQIATHLRKRDIRRTFT